MSSLTNTKIKDTYPALLKATDNGQLSATEKVITDGVGNNSTLSLGTNSASVAGTLAFGSLKDSGENITITKFVDEADGIAANDNDTTIPTSAAVKNYVDNAIPTEADTLATVTARGSSTNTAITVQGLRLSTGANTAGIVLGNPTALLDNTTGESNIAIGEFGTLADNTTGNNNIGLGSSSLRFNTTGNNNTAIGISALTNNTTGSFNTAIGSSALRNINGSGNFAMGYNAGANIDALPSEKTGGSDNIYIGSESKSGAISTDNEIVIGANAIGNGSNTATYGNASIVEHYFTAGDVYMNNDLFGLDVIGNSFGATEYIRIGAGDVRLGAGGTDRVIVDSSGNVGIGTSTSPGTNGGGLAIYKSDFPRLTFRNSTTGDGLTDGTQFVAVGSDFEIYNREVGDLYFGTSDTERMRIDSSGHLILKEKAGAITPPSNGLSLLTGFGVSYLFSKSTGNAETDMYYNASIHSFNTGNTERMRITSDGRLLYNTTSLLTYSDAMVQVAATGSNWGATFEYQGTTSGRGAASFVLSGGSTTPALINFQYSGGTVGSISTNGSTTSYNITSDYRLKENVVEMTGALDRVDALKPSRFNFISTPNITVDGFIAHEVQEVVPEAVTGEKDAVDEEGNPIYQGIDQSKLTPLLTAALKEAHALIKSLEARIEILEAK